MSMSCPVFIYFSKILEPPQREVVGPKYKGLLIYKYYLAFQMSFVAVLLTTRVNEFRAERMTGAAAEVAFLSVPFKANRIHRHPIGYAATAYMYYVTKCIMYPQS